MAGSTHFPPHAYCPAGQFHPHAPATHTWVPGQIAPPVQSGAAPQKARSVEGSTHRPPQASCGDWQAAADPWQTAPAQTCPLPQTAPPVHAAVTPQWAGSTFGSMQAPRQLTRFGAQDAAQRPEEHTWPPTQATPSVQVVAPQ